MHDGQKDYWDIAISWPPLSAVSRLWGRCGQTRVRHPAQPSMVTALHCSLQSLHPGTLTCIHTFRIIAIMYSFYKLIFSFFSLRPPASFIALIGTHRSYFFSLIAYYQAVLFYVDIFLNIFDYLSICILIVGFAA